MRHSRQKGPHNDLPKAVGKTPEKQADTKKKRLGASLPPTRYTTSMSTRTEENIMMIQGWIGDEPCLVTLDIRSSLTLARPDIAAGLPERKSRRRALKTASGEIIPIFKEASVKLTLGRYSVKIWVPFVSITN
jgi:hypothetical protein